MTETHKPLAPDDMESERRRLLQCLLEEEDGADTDLKDGQRIEVRERASKLPLSFPQQRLWVLHQLVDDDSAYNIATALRLTGRLHVTALEAAFNELIRRHEVLRTTFVGIDDQPVQVVSDSRRMDVPIIDLCALPFEVREVVTADLIATDALQPFDLEQGPLLRARLVLLPDEEHVLIFGMHHIVSDGWSVGILKKEIASSYDVFAKGLPSLLKELEIQYGDFAIWQRHWLQGSDAAAHLEYWKTRLASCPPITALPGRDRRPVVQTLRGGSETITLPQTLGTRLKVLSGKEHATLFMLLLAAFKILIYRYTGQHDVVVGTPIANRTRKEIENLIGLFLNSLVLRTDLSGNPTFRQVLSRAREVAIEAYAHQDIPFEMLVDELEPQRDLSRTPLFQLMINMLNLDDDEMELPGLSALPIGLEETQSKFDLTLYLTEHEAEITVVAVFNSDILDRITVARMLEHFRAILFNAAVDPDGHIESLPLEAHEVQAADVTRPLEGFSPSTSDETAFDPGSIWDCFARYLTACPDKIAVTGGTGELSYAELGRRARGIAEAVSNRLGNESERIALIFDHGMDMISALLGVLAAGKTYLPLDARYPRERLEHMLEDSQASALLVNSRSHKIAALLDNSRLPIIDIDSIALSTDSITVPRVSNISVAYILYTSGSTGNPKGVVQNHRNVLHHISTYANALLISPEDRLSLLSSYSFDAAVMDIFGALLNGATLCPMDIKSEGIDSVPEWLAEQNITVYHSTPTVYRYLTGILKDSVPLQSVRLVVLGGEEVTCGDVEQYRKCFPERCGFVNGLGPTESTLALQHFATHNQETVGDSVSVGYPVQGTSVVLLNEAGRQFGVYGTGEIVIRSPYIALGYWRRPNLTAEAFLPDPEGVGQREYRTGDIGRLLPDDTIEYVCRKDHQIKVRGFRVEPAEIEWVLSSHPKVQKAVVVHSHASLPDIGLIGYVLVRETSPPTAAELAAFSRERLPDYMVPSAFRAVERFPLTPNGKIDRDALASSYEEAPDPAAVAVPVPAPVRTPVAEIMAGIVSEVLGIEHVSENDNFFDLGGHSLLAMMVVSRTRKALGVDLSLRSFFEQPTVAALSAWIEDARLQGAVTKPRLIYERQLRIGVSQFPHMAEDWPDIDSGAFPQRNETKENQQQLYPLSLAQQRLYFLYEFFPASSQYNIPAAVRLAGKLQVTALEDGLSEAARRQSSLRTTFTMSHGEPVQIVNQVRWMQMFLVDLRGLAESDAETEMVRLAQEEASHPFDIKSGPVFRTHLIFSPKDDYTLLFTMHHIVSDGWSANILARDLAGVYDAFAEGARNPLGDLAIAYPDFAVWQRDWLQRDFLESELDYWKRQLAGAPSTLPLPLDRPRPVVADFRGARQFHALPAELSGRLHVLSRREGATLFMTLLAAYGALLGRHTGQEDFVVGTPIAGRNQPEIENIIGLFVNTLVLRLDLSGKPSFADLLNRVREAALGAFDHQEMPFEKLVAELVPDRNKDRQPLVQAMFVLQNIPPVDLAIRGLSIASIDVSSDTAKFDLTLSLVEDENGLMDSWEYNLDLFDAATITRFAEHYKVLLEAVVEDTRYPIWQVPLLGDRERHQILQEWNDSVDLRSQKCLHESLDTQVELRPDSVAVVCGDEWLSYADLQRRANQVANYLRRSGIAPESLVGLYLVRGIQLIVAIAGVLKAGGAYVPLDPDWPAARVAFVLDDTSAPLLLTEEALVPSLPSYQGTVLALDRDWGLMEREGQEGPLNVNTPDNAAYVIYTSGSTGLPKGVLVTHLNASRLFDTTSGRFHFDSDDVWTLFHSQAFDFSVWEIWGALLFGGRIIIIPYLVSRSTQDFSQLVSAQAVTVLNQTPSAFRQFIEATRENECHPSLRLVIFGGEALDPPRLLPWIMSHTDTGPELINMYGITETTVHVTYRQITTGDITGAQRSPIGRAIPDLQLYVLDHLMELAPIGVTGELYVAGVGLARCYLNRPELTAERFLANSFSASPGSRVYRTGDLGRHLPDGQVEYKGRRDNQVKIRGFRIELGEVEAALRTEPSVQDAIVIADRDQASEKRLVAYVSTASDRPNLRAELRNHLKAKLPEYMVPSAFVLVDHFPLSPNGKVDKAKLPRPDKTRPDLAEAFAAPMTGQEQVMADIWAQVLGLDKVGLDDNFFALGGDSILSLRVKALADESGVPFSLEELFHHQNVRTLVGAIVDSEQANPGTPRTEPFSLVSERDRLMLPDGVIDAYPLAALQMGMLFHTEYTSASAYHDVFSFHLHLVFSLEALQQAAQEVVDHHDVLRTTFDISRFSEPLQLVHERIEASVNSTDISHLIPEAQGNAIEEWIEQELSRQFDLATGPLLRFHAHRRSDATFQFTVAFHHAILDGWSNASLLTELFHRYELILGRRTDPVAAAPIVAYRDFVAEERRIVRSEEAARYWVQELEGSWVSSVPRWPSSDANETKSLASSREEVSIPEEICRRLRRLSSELGVPLKSVLLAAHMRVVSLITGQDDVTTGVIANGRLEEQDGDRVLGLFLNTVPFRLRLRGGTWRDLVEFAFETDRRNLQYRRYPLAEIQRIRGGQPMFETVFNYVQFHIYDLMDGHDVEVLGKTSFEEFNLPFVAYFSPEDETIGLALSYHTAEFGSEQIRTIVRYYLNAFASIAENPDRRYDTCCLLPADEQQRLVLSTAYEAHPELACVHDLFAEEARAIPEAAAVVFGEETITYGELSLRSTALALRLRNAGVESDVLVGICLERSLNTIIAVMATLKAGGACLPLDPAYPPHRLSLILDDSRARVLLTQSTLLDKLAPNDAEVICLDDGLPTSFAGTDDKPVCDVPISSAAYVIYTSGSTGKPKGVIQTHECLSNLVEWHRISGPSENRTLQFASLNFDVSFQEIFSTLCLRGLLFLVPEPARTDPVALARLIAEARIERFHIPNVVLDGLAREFADDAAHLTSLREMMVGGEQLQITKPLAQFLSRLDRCRLHNHYGPSETHVITSYLLPLEVDRWPALPSIGRPIAGTTACSLDKRRMIVPTCVTGDLYLGGSALARGYLNRPDLTAEKFVPDPNGKGPSGRLYRTGDRARVTPDGNIDFIGRDDRQVKIRGQRVELSEIEACLLECVSLKEVAVTLKEDTAGDRQILAYVVPRRDGEFDARTVRTHVRERLPGHMVPSAIVPIGSMPRTPNGKVDRLALPELKNGFGNVTPKSSPRTPLEEEVAGIWREVLAVDRVELDENFFDIGGHSILATEVVSRARKVFRTEIPLRSLFESQSLADFAGFISRRLDNGSFVLAGDIEPVFRGPEIEPSFAQERMWLLDQLDPDHLAYAIFFPTCLTGPLNRAVLEQSLSEIVRRHEAFRTTFPMRGGRLVQVIGAPSNLTVDIVDLGGLDGRARDEETQRLALGDSQCPFDLSNGPLIRNKLLHVEMEHHVLLTAMHHIVSDGWSLGILVHELGVLYQAYLSGEQSPLEELSIQYADYASWQRQLLGENLLTGQLSYWKSHLDGAAPALELPTDHTRPRIQTFRGTREHFVVSDAVVDRIRVLNRHAGVTLFMTLQAVLETLLYRYSGQIDFCLGTPIANRIRTELEGLIGLFVNTVVLRADLSGNPPLLSLLERVREDAIGAYSHPDVPFELLVEELAAERGLGRSPIFQVMSVLNNAPLGALQLREIALSPIEVDSSASKFDITFAAIESGGELFCSFEYNTSLFDRVTIERLITHFQRLLQAAVDTPEVRVGELPLMSVSEEHQVHLEWNDTLTGIPQSPCIHELFEAQAVDKADAVAALFEDCQLTYHDLNRRAGQLAGYLGRLGIRPGMFVGISVERSLEMLVGLLGILKAGAAYVPFEPMHPRPRLAIMIQDSRTAVLLTQEKFASSLPVDEHRVICLDTDWGTIARSGGDSPVSDLPSEALCYVIYTSGSTGEPKGAMNTHRAVVSRLRWMQSEEVLGESRCFLQNSPFTFDLSALELFAPLVEGATLVLAKPGGHRDPRYLAELIEEQAITVVHFVPSMLQAFIEENSAKRLASLKRVVCGGEALGERLKDKFFERFPAELSNIYGPTETSIFVTVWRCRPDEGVSIGSPVSDTGIHIIDWNKEWLGIGVPGELCVSGVGAAGGYLNRPEMTAEKFEPNPHTVGPGARRYRTGDIARFNKDGSLAYLGRMDHQVKVRGFRIELGEIESALSHNQAVDACAVLARQGATGDVSLVGYVASGLSSLTPNDLRASLLERLPHYMVPAAFVIRESLPTNSNGKVDRRALRGLGDNDESNQSQFVPPRTAVERTLASICNEVLGVEHISIDADFFEMGGHSLSATRLISQIGRRFQIQIPIRSVFEYPTIGRLAELIEAALLEKLQEMSEDEAESLLRSMNA